MAETRIRQRLAERLGNRSRFLGARVVQQHGELVAAQSGDQVATACALAQQRAHLDQQPVSGKMAECVVDVLEVVEVDVEQCADAMRAARALHDAFDLLQKETAIVETGETVVLGLCAQMLHHRSAFADVRDQCRVEAFTLQLHATDLDGHREVAATLALSADFAFLAD